MGAPLVKTRTILIRFGFTNGLPTFLVEADPDEEIRETRLLLDRDVYEDMGQPATITVTIEPGDLLNAENAVEAT